MKIKYFILFTTLVLVVSVVSCNDGGKNPTIPPNNKLGVKITSPTHLSVVNGTIHIKGSYSGEPTSIEGMLDNKTFAVTFSDGSWSGKVDTAKLNAAGTEPLYYDTIHTITVAATQDIDTKGASVFVTTNNNALATGTDYSEPGGSHVSGKVLVDNELPGSYAISSDSPLYIYAINIDTDQVHMSGPITSGGFPYDYSNLLNLQGGDYFIEALLDIGNNGADDSDLYGGDGLPITIDGSTHSIIPDITLYEGEITGSEVNPAVWYTVSGTIHLPGGVSFDGTRRIIVYDGTMGYVHEEIGWTGNSMTYSFDVPEGSYSVVIEVTSDDGSLLYVHIQDDFSFDVNSDMSDYPFNLELHL